MTDSAEGTPSGFDPAEHTAKEVVAHLEKHPEEAEEIAQLEAEGKDRVTVAEAAEEVVDAKPKKKRKVHTGTYVLEAGDSPFTVAQKLLGRGSRGRELVAANPDVKWRPGVEIQMPKDPS